MALRVGRKWRASRARCHSTAPAARAVLTGGKINFRRRCVFKIPSWVTTREPGAARTYGGHIGWYNRATEGSLPADLSPTPRGRWPPYGTCLQRAMREEEPQGAHWLHPPNARATYARHTSRASKRGRAGRGDYPLSARHGPRRMRTRVLRRVAGTARTRYAAAAMLTYSVLRTASAPCAGRLGVFTCIPEGVHGDQFPN